MSRTAIHWGLGALLATTLSLASAEVQAAQVTVASVPARPGETVGVGAALALGPGEEVAAVSLEIRFDPELVVVESCIIAPRIGPGTAANKSLVWSLPAEGRLRAGIFGINLNAISAGSLLTCSFKVDTAAPGGPLPLASFAGAAAPLGSSVAITATSGAIDVDADPDADGFAYTQDSDPCTGGQVQGCEDNCPFVPNPDQADVDGNGIGDACECGDASGDGRVNTTDVRLIQRCAVGQLEGPTCTGLCDVTGDGRCDTTDARLIQRLVVGDLEAEELTCSAKRFEP